MSTKEWWPYTIRTTNIVALDYANWMTCHDVYWHVTSRSVYKTTFWHLCSTETWPVRHRDISWDKHVAFVGLPMCWYQIDARTVIKRSVTTVVSITRRAILRAYTNIKSLISGGLSLGGRDVCSAQGRKLLMILMILMILMRNVINNSWYMQWQIEMKTIDVIKELKTR